MNLARKRKSLEDGGNVYFSNFIIKASFPVFDASPSVTLDYAIRKLVAVKAHRLWIVDEEGKLNGVLSLTDIIKVLLPK